MLDIDECDSGNGGCEQNCQNNIGSYTCSCNTGYEKSGFHGCIGTRVQWNPSITATIGTRIFGRFRGVAANQGVQRSHAIKLACNSC